MLSVFQNVDQLCDVGFDFLFLVFVCLFVFLIAAKR